MKTLYIIGNGFDMGHDLDTSYWAFRTFLNENEETHSFLRDLEELYGIYYGDFEVEEFEERAKNILWKEFENNLQYANDGDMESMAESIVRDMVTGEGEPMQDIRDTLNIYWEPYYQFIVKLNEYVEKWIKNVDISRLKVKCKGIYKDENSYFLTFNYTKVLEDRYKISPEKILHIHGCVDSLNAPVMGHGGKKKIEEYAKIQDRAEREFNDGKASIYGAMTEFYENSLKDVEKYILGNENYFRKLCGVNCVKVIGHSLGEVDMPYFKKIRKSVMPDAQWNFYTYIKQEESKEEIQLKKQKVLDDVKCLRIKRNKLKVIDAKEFWE